MRSVDQSMRMQDFEILANGYLGCLELAGKFGDEYTSLMVQKIENGAAAFFVEQVDRPGATPICAPTLRRAFLFIAFGFVCPEEIDVSLCGESDVTYPSSSLMDGSVLEP